MSDYYDTHITNRLAQENTFRNAQREEAVPPTFADNKHLLPQPFWQGHSSTIDCYWRVWEIAFRNLFRPTAANGFIANYIDTAFNGNLFMWDSAFILLFARYGSRVFNFQRTLDNLYCKQHADGFICREISESDGLDVFYRFDPSSTGPNVMPWTEWEYFLTFGDRDRLARVFPVLAAYHQWLRVNRTWQDGSYWTSGWGSGMDNQPRPPVVPGYDAQQVAWWSNGQMTWVDACMQQVLSARLLLRMADVLGRADEMRDMQQELGSLTNLVNDTLWDERTAFYYDRYRDGSHADVKTIGAYWALLAGVVPAARIAPFIAHLSNTREFNRPHRVPSMAADHPAYREDGGYWLGGVWPPTNYMILRGLSEIGAGDLAHEIAMNHLDNVTRIFETTGTVWENLAPEFPKPGNPAKGDFVGWGGLPATAVLFEYAFGLRPDCAHNTLVWDVHLTEEHGIRQYPYGKDGLLNLTCAARKSTSERPQIVAESNVPLTLRVVWHGQSETYLLTPGASVDVSKASSSSI
jgi:hypothetical protein